MKTFSEIKKWIACDSVGKPDSAVGRAVCLSVYPGKMLLYPFLHWFRYHYAGRSKFARLLFGFDLFLIGTTLTLGALAVYFTFVVPQSFEDRIIFSSTIAPREVVTGAPATIVIRYVNGTSEPLHNVQLTVDVPAYFVLQDLQGIPEESIELIPPGESGTIHLKGVMFGDVGGQQAFKTRMTFVYGEQKDQFGEKIDYQIFTPTRSALVLTLELPERMTAFQPMTGVVRYQNTGEIAFPAVSIVPEWPDAFTMTNSEIPMESGTFTLPSIAPGQTRAWHFTGSILQDIEEITFIFHPSFTFGEDKFRQQTLFHTAPVVPLPLTITTNSSAKTALPGSVIPVTVTYENTTAFELTDVVITLESSNPLFKQGTSKTFELIAPGEQGKVELKAQLASTLFASQTDVYEHLTLSIRAVSTYRLGDSTSQRIHSIHDPVVLPLTSPVRLESFVRYFTPSGDQIGRGPLPPEPGMETTFWVFWHIGGTTNDLSTVTIEGKLPEGVRFTGRQTVSQNGSITYDEQSQIVMWTSSSVPPTLAPNSKIVGVAFELGITPDAPLSSAPLLLTDILLTATDAWTGEFVSASGANLKAVWE